MVLGAPGSGKTTFCLYLAGVFCRSGKSVSWIDADPGQPFLGPPAVLSLSPLFNRSGPSQAQDSPVP